GGVKRGHVFGDTDELGYHAIENPIHVHDVQATMLHCLGIDHEGLTFRHKGRDFRLTDVAGEVIDGVLA
ncbi:MAG: sulfatase, partial [Planctomycetaceae bacterium]|nr:sulfatase [Planctomycetaceae bacterium]